MVDKLALGQDFVFEFFSFPVSIIPPMLNTHSVITYAVDNAVK
jgi:hypothetical protein